MLWEKKQKWLKWLRFTNGEYQLWPIDARQEPDPRGDSEEYYQWQRKQGWRAKI